MTSLNASKLYFLLAIRLQGEVERLSETGEKELQVHYQGWDRKYDEWRKERD